MNRFAYYGVIAGCMVAYLGDRSPCSGTEGGAHERWKMGDCWTVRTWYATVMNRAREGEAPTFVRKGKEVLVSFSVGGTKEVEGHACHEIMGVFPKDGTGFQRRYLLYFRADTGRLVRVVNHSVRTDGSVMHSVTRLSVDGTGPTIVRDPPGGILFDFPDFRLGDGSATDGDGWENSQVVSTQTLKDPDGQEHSAREIVLTRSKGDQEIKTVQTWVEGEPWWRRAVKYENGKIINEAELVRPTSEDGQ